MAWCEPEVVCMKHPNHKQQPGVCSCCLRERLSKLSGPPAMVVSSSSCHDYNNNNKSSLSNVSSPAYSSASSSPSPSHRRRHHRIASDVLISFSFVTNGSSGLKKSRSIAFAATGRVRDGAKGKKKQGFWSKLLKSKGKRSKEAGLHAW